MADPAAYATVDDVLARYEQDVVDRICYDTVQEQPDYARLERALEDAAGEIDSYISARYPVPVTPAPALLRNINVDLGMYSAALTADKLTDELSARAENWRKHLVLIAKGQAGLGIRENASLTDTVPAGGTGVISGAFARSQRV